MLDLFVLVLINALVKHVFVYMDGGLMCCVR